MNIQKRWGRLRGIWILILLGAVLSVLLSMDGSETGKTPGKEAPLPEWGISPLDSPEPLAVIRETELALNQPDLPVRDLWDIGRRLLPNVDASFQTSQRTSREYQLGDEAEFWVNNQDIGENVRVRARLVHITPHVYVWLQDGLEVSEEDLVRSAEIFEREICPTDLRYFGSGWEQILGEGERISILNARFTGAAGYYSSADEYSSRICPYSNGRKMFYMNVDALRPGSEEYNGALAHEFQHMIHWHLDPNEDTWVNEGASELASHLNGYAETSRIQAFLQDPDTQLNAWSDQPDDAYAHYGAARLIMQYFLERFGEDALRRLISNPAKGIRGFDEILAAYGLGFDDFFRDWVVANYLDDPSLMDGRYGYRRLELPDVTPVAVHDRYPVTVTGTVCQYAADYVVLQPAGSDVRIEFEGTSTVDLIPNCPHSGNYQWWSNRGDLSDCRLTGEFDLTEVDSATLRFWLWYDIENGWDYAYVEASTDAGTTWDILRGTHSTDYNPNGNSLGWGYTGISGGGSDPHWIEESVDLSGYAGEKVWIRFEYITDDAINRVGLCLDDVSIPEIGYFDDAESGDHGWQAEGFVRVGSVLPQRYAVQVVQFGPDVVVTPMILDSRQRGDMRILGFGSNVERAVLVISGLTPVTTEVAQYRYRITPVE